MHERVLLRKLRSHSFELLVNTADLQITNLDKPGWMRIPALVNLHEKFHQNSTFDSKIVGGNEATPHSYPHQVGIFIDGGFFCGGSLIGLIL